MMEGSGIMVQGQTITLHDKMFNSFVTVVETNREKEYGDHSCGFVILNNDHTTFILTSSFLVKDKSSILTVCFSDERTRKSEVLYEGKKFSILAVQRVNSAVPVRFRNDVKREAVVLLAPINSYTSPTRLSAFVLAPTCLCKDYKLRPVKKSGNFFVINACFQDQGHHCKSRLMSAPVYDTSGNGIGVVFSDMVSPRRDLEGPNYMQRVFRGSCVDHLLNKMVGNDNWQNHLMGMGPRETKPAPSERKIRKFKSRNKV